MTTLLDQSTSCSRVSGTSSRSQTVPHERKRKLKIKLTSNNFALQPFVPSHSFAGAVTGARLKAAHSSLVSSRPFVSGEFCGVCKIVTTMFKYRVFSRTILSGLGQIKWCFGPLECNRGAIIVHSRDRVKWSSVSELLVTSSNTAKSHVRRCSSRLSVIHPWLGQRVCGSAAISRR